MSPVALMTSRRCPSTLTLFLVFVAVTSVVLAAPPGVRWKRRTSGHVHGGAMPSTFNYRVIRVAHCKSDENLFGDCYLCGKITEEIRIYEGCCKKEKVFTDFCHRLLA